MKNKKIKESMNQEEIFKALLSGEIDLEKAKFLKELLDDEPIKEIPYTKTYTNLSIVDTDVGRPLRTFICANCGKEFTCKRKRKYCDYNCSYQVQLDRYKKKTFKRTCYFCGDKFETTNSLKKYCNSNCRKNQCNKDYKEYRDTKKQDK